MTISIDAVCSFKHRKLDASHALGLVLIDLQMAVTTGWSKKSGYPVLFLG